VGTPAVPELGYAEFTGQIDCTATVEASADTVVTSPAVSVDGVTPIIVEFFCETFTASLTTFDGILCLFEDGASIGRIFQGRTIIALAGTASIFSSRRLTPANGVHTYSVRGLVSSAGTFSVFGGTGGSGNRVPGYIRVVRAA
jgi:hypothetical protein